MENKNPIGSIVLGPTWWWSENASFTKPTGVVKPKHEETKNKTKKKKSFIIHLDGNIKATNKHNKSVHSSSSSSL